MRGRFVHNRVLLAPIRRYFLALGATLKEEYSVRLEGTYGAIDLFVWLGRARVAIEAECTADRVQKDVRKAIAARADSLYIVMPTAKLVRSAQRKGYRDARTVGGDLTILVAPLGPMLERLRRSFPVATMQPCVPTAPERRPRSRSDAYIWRPDRTPKSRSEQVVEG